MIIDLIDENGNGILRYTTDHIPSIGDTISSYKPENLVMKVLRIDFLVSPSLNGDNNSKLSLLTITVRKL